MSRSGFYSEPKVVSYLRRCHFHSCFGLSQNDCETVLQCLVIWDLVISDTLPKRHPVFRSWHSWLYSQKVIELEQLAMDLETLADATALAFEVRSLGDLGTSLDRTGLVKVFRPLIARFLEKPDWINAYRMRQCIEFPRRLSVGPGDVDACIATWLKARRAIHAVSDPGLHQWISRLVPDERDFIPYHSSGATVERSRRMPNFSKGRFLRYDSSFIRTFEGIEQFAVGRYGRIDRTAVGETVPKSILKPRFISKEPTSLQWAQHGVATMLRRAIKRDPIFSSMINLEDSTRNTQLAQRGSICGKFATVDLSSASDSVSHHLCCCSMGAWLPYLEAVRSVRIMLPNGSTVRQRSMSPMGSATCFPTETVIFAALCLVAAGDPKYADLIRVYGDDIVCPVEIVDDVISLLEQTGFRVNHQKSFTFPYRNGCFRESCGGEFFDGVNITPERISRRFSMIFPMESWGDRVANGLQWAICANNLAGTARKYAYSRLHDCLGDKADKLIRSYRPDVFLRTPVPHINRNHFRMSKINGLSRGWYEYNGYWFVEKLEDSDNPEFDRFEYYQRLAMAYLTESERPLVTTAISGRLPTGNFHLQRIRAHELDLL